MIHFDERFIRLCVDGDKRSQKQLFERLYPPMFRVCMRYLAHQADAEDCLMLGFMKVFQNISRFNYEGEHSMFVWTRKIVVNESLMFIRQRQNLMFVIGEQTPDIPLQAEIINSMEAEELNHCIMNLPPGYRTVFNLNVVEGYDHKEIAAMLNISEVTSRSQLAKAKSKLREIIRQTNQCYEESGK